MENKFKDGEIVYERIRPNQKLVVKRFFKGVYHCTADERTNGKELFYFEGDLAARTQKNN